MESWNTMISNSHQLTPEWPKWFAWIGEGWMQGPTAGLTGGPVGEPAPFQGLCEWNWVNVLGNYQCDLPQLRRTSRGINKGDQLLSKDSVNETGLMSFRTTRAICLDWGGTNRGTDSRTDSGTSGGPSLQCGKDNPTLKRTWSASKPTMIGKRGSQSVCWSTVDPNPSHVACDWLCPELILVNKLLHDISSTYSTMHTPKSASKMQAHGTRGCFQCYWSLSRPCNGTATSASGQAPVWRTLVRTRKQSEPGQMEQKQPARALMCREGKGLACRASKSHLLEWFEEQGWWDQAREYRDVLKEVRGHDPELARLHEMMEMGEARMSVYWHQH